MNEPRPRPLALREFRTASDEHAGPGNEARACHLDLTPKLLLVLHNYTVLYWSFRRASKSYINTMPSPSLSLSLKAYQVFFCCFQGEGLEFRVKCIKSLKYLAIQYVQAITNTTSLLVHALVDFLTLVLVGVYGHPMWFLLRHHSYYIFTICFCVATIWREHLFLSGKPGILRPTSSQISDDVMLSEIVSCAVTFIECILCSFGEYSAAL